MNILGFLALAGAAAYFLSPDDATGEGANEHAIRKARADIRRVLAGKGRTDVPHSLYREEVGWVGFQYGRANRDPETKRHNGHGLAYIVARARETHGTYEGSPTVDELLDIIPEVIVNSPAPVKVGKFRKKFEWKRHIVIITQRGKNPKSPNWVFHSYKLYPKK
ncbi:MAG: hypothetical protein LBK99_05155 [Opitutaceae bacterium]|jgi:hypothetical protein|nr:hypothetical protein [Opitutaceae bacterium]